MKLLTLSLTLGLSTVLLADQQSLETRVAKLEKRIATLEKLVTSSSTREGQHPIVGKWTQEGISQTMEFRSDKTLILSAGNFTVLGTYKVLEDGNIEFTLKEDKETKVLKPVFEGSLLTLSETDGSDAQVFVKTN